MTFFKSLRFRLILLVLIAVVPALAITLYSGLEQRRLARLNAEANANQLAGLLANYQSDQVEGARQLLLSLTLMPEIHEPATCGRYLQQLQRIYSIYNSLSVARIDGQVICSSAESNSAANIADREYFREVTQTHAFVIGQTIVGRLTQKPGLPLALPVMDEKGNPAYVLVATFDLNQIVDFVKTMNLPPQFAALIIDQDGSVIMRYPETEKWSGQSLPNTPIIQRILSQRSVGSAEVPGVDGVTRLYAFTPLPSSTGQNVYAAIGMPSSIAYAEAERSMISSLLGIGIAALLALCFAWFGGDIFFLRVVSLTAERDQAEQLLKEANAGLEGRVAQRTAELAQVNEQLKMELAERQKTELKLRHREQELREMLVLIERSNRDLQDFAYVASHDLQEPLRKIQAFGDRLANRYSDELSGEGSEFIQRMTGAASRMQLMINDLLTYSRVTTQGHSFEKTDLNQVAQEVVSDLEIRIHDTQGTVEIEELPHIDADPLQIRQLFQNLIANALKFHQPDMPPVVRVSGKVQALDDSDGRCHVVLRFEDNGIGFDEKYLDRIFQPFQRLHGRNAFEGSGIGLAVCRKIIERHGGKITATSQINIGSTFIITLPVEQPRQEKNN